MVLAAQASTQSPPILAPTPSPLVVATVERHLGWGRWLLLFTAVLALPVASSLMTRYYLRRRNP